MRRVDIGSKRLDMIKYIAGALVASWHTFASMSPYLLFGFLIAGVLSVLISAQTVERHLGKSGLWSVVKAACLGVPLPLCSCGVIPVGASLRRHGASRGATASFLISTPQTGVDSIMVTLVMLGPAFAVVRPLAAFFSGVLGGAAIEAATGRSDGTEDGDATPSATCVDPCGTAAPERSALLRAAHYGLVSLPASIGRGLIIGVLLAGVISALIPDDFFAATIGTGFTAMLVMLLAGVPTYVCATASVPVAAAMMAKGVSPGAALVFLMTGPATNAATIAVLWNTLGRVSAVIYLVVVAGSALAAGLLMDGLLLPQVPESVAHAHHAAGSSPLEWFSALILAGVMADALRPKKDRDGETAPAERPQLDLTVKGMTCEHCAEAVRSELMNCSGVDWVGVNLKKGRVSVSGSDLDSQCLLDAVKKAGFGGTLAENEET